jgi:hypothetical protein
MFDKIKSIITIEKILKDCDNYIDKQQTYDISYLEFLKYFKELKKIEKHHLVIGINFTYGWMPTILDFRSENFDVALDILNNAKYGNVPSKEQLEILKGLFNNSLVGTSKLLHFINPEKFAIWDSRVYSYLTGEKPYQNRIGNCKSYLEFLEFCGVLTNKKDYEIVHNKICEKLGYQVTKFRSVELIMYLNGGSK